MVHTLYYQTWPNVDIVPCARYSNAKGEVTHYSIPDSNRGVWIDSRPKTHSRDIEERSTTCGPWFRRIIKMVKWWNHRHSEYLQSYHLEVIALNAFSGALNDVPWYVNWYFAQAVELIAAPLWHAGSQVDAYLTDGDRAEARKRLETATALAGEAWFATFGMSSDHKQAIAKWRQVFGDRFPAYG